MTSQGAVSSILVETGRRREAFFVSMLSVIVPCYNEEENILLFYSELLDKISVLTVP